MLFFQGSEIRSTPFTRSKPIDTHIEAGHESVQMIDSCIDGLLAERKSHG